MPTLTNGQAAVTDEEPSLADEVYHQILLRIVHCELPGGTELKTTRLAKEMGVSRTPIIQALARLAADGIVVQQRNQRAVVRPGAENWLIELHELRLLIEPPAAARAAANIGPEAIAELQRLASAAEPRDDPAWMRASKEFDYAMHLAIAEHAGNLPLREAIRKCWSYKRISYDAGQDTPETLRLGYQDHLALLEALRAGDAELARAAMLFHLHHAASWRIDSRIV
jgi:DNA-binding GntR family transcriptional regulator